MFVDTGLSSAAHDDDVYEYDSSAGMTANNFKVSLYNLILTTIGAV